MLGEKIGVTNVCCAVDTREREVYPKSERDIRGWRHRRDLGGESKERHLGGVG